MPANWEEDALEKLLIEIESIVAEAKKTQELIESLRETLFGQCRKASEALQTLRSIAKQRLGIDLNVYEMYDKQGLVDTQALRRLLGLLSQGQSPSNSTATTVTVAGVTAESSRALMLRLLITAVNDDRNQVQPMSAYLRQLGVDLNETMNRYLLIPPGISGGDGGKVSGHTSPSRKRSWPKWWLKEVWLCLHGVNTSSNLNKEETYLSERLEKVQRILTTWGVELNISF